MFAIDKTSIQENPMGRKHSHADKANADDDAMFDTSPKAFAEVLNGTAQSQIKSVIERYERLAEEKSEIAEQQKEVLAEAKGNGFDVKILRKVIAIRKQDRAQRQEDEAILDLYLTATGDAI